MWHFCWYITYSINDTLETTNGVPQKNPLLPPWSHSAPDRTVVRSSPARKPWDQWQFPQKMPQRSARLMFTNPDMGSYEVLHMYMNICNNIYICIHISNILNITYIYIYISYSIYILHIYNIISIYIYIFYNIYFHKYNI